MVSGQIRRHLVPAVRGLGPAVNQEQRRVPGGPPIEEVEPEPVQRRRVIRRAQNGGSSLDASVPRRTTLAGSPARTSVSSAGAMSNPSPRDIELRTFPEPIVSRTGKLASCRYFVVEGQIAIVDPEADKVVLLVEQR